jgi:hypothetical protein
VRISAALIFEVASAPAAIDAKLFETSGPIRNVNPATSTTRGDGNHLFEIDFWL